MDRPKLVFEYRLAINGKVVFDKPVEVRRYSELNGIVQNYTSILTVGDEIVITVKRVI